MATRSRAPKNPNDEIPEDEDIVDENWQVPVTAPGAVHRSLLPSPDEEQSPAERITAMLESAATADRTKVSVYRIGDTANELVWANNYTIQQFEDGGDLQLIRRQFGAGRYSIRIYGKQAGTNRVGILSRLDLDILADPDPAPTPQVNPVASGGIGVSELSQVLALLTERLAAPPPPPVDPMAQMTAMFSMMKLAREAFGPTAAPPAQKSLVEQLTELRALQEVAGELAPKGGKDDEPSLLGLGAQMMDMVKTHVQSRPPQLVAVPPVRMPPSLEYPDVPDEAWTPQRIAEASREQPQPQSQPQPQPQPQEAPVSTQTAAPDSAAEVARVTKILGQFVELAEKKAPAQEGAELLCGDEEGNEGLPDELFNLLLQDDWWQTLTSVPAISLQLKPHEAWVREVREIIAEWIRTDEQADSASQTGLDAVGQLGRI